MRLCVAARWAVALLLTAPACASAQQVHVQLYDVKDGLSHGRVPAISSDASGYLWFATWEGLSCFDGERFTRYDVGDGLLDPLVNAIAHDAQGGLWAATWGRGLAWLPRMPAPGRPTVETFAIGPQRQAGLAFDCALDQEQRLWMATELGVYRSLHSVPRASTEGSRDSVRFEPTALRDIARLTSVEDGAVWLAAPRTLLRSTGSRIDSFPTPGNREFSVADLISDRAGGVWLAEQRAVWRVTLAASAIWDSLPLALPDGVAIRCLASEEPSTLWIGTSGGLYRLSDGEWMHWSRADGLRDDFVRTLGFDREGDLWFSNDSRGVARFSGESMVGFRELQTDEEVHCLSVVVARDQRAYATTARRGILELRDGIGALVPGSLAPEFNDINYCLVQDAREDWWAGSALGLFYAPGPELDFRKARRVDPGGDRVRVIGIGYDEARDRPRFEPHRIPFPDSLTGIRAFAFDRGGRTWISGFVGLAV